MIHEVGNIELCELLETEPKTQCTVCLSYWDIGIVYCTCGHFLRKGREENQKFIEYTMDLLSIPDYYKKKGRPHGHRYGKKPGDREYYIATDFYEMNNSAVECFKLGEPKIFVDKWMILRTKIIPTIWPHKNVSITKVIGGFVRTRQVPILCQCSADLTSNKQCLLCSNWKKKKKKKLNETKDGHRVLLLLLHVGGGKVLGGLLISMKVTMEMNQVLIEQGDLFGTILQGMIFLNSFTLLQMDRLQLTAVYCNRRGVWIPHLKWRISSVQNVCTKYLQVKFMMNCYSMTTRWEFGHEVTSGWQSTTRMPVATFMLAWHSTIRTSMTSFMIAWLRTMRTPATTSTERRAHFLRCLHLHTHTCTLAQVWVFHIISMAVHVCAVSSPWSSLSTSSSSSPQGMSPRPMTSTRPQSTHNALRAAPGLAAALLRQSLQHTTTHNNTHNTQQHTTTHNKTTTPKHKTYIPYTLSAHTPHSLSTHTHNTRHDT